MTGRSVVFMVAGRPRPQGSKRGFVHKNTNRVVMVEQGAHTKDWRARVAFAAQEAMRGRPVFGGPVKVRAEFLFARPKSHFGTGRNANRLKPDAPSYPTGRNIGDIDKLLRALFDALTGPVWVDDSQVVVVAAECVFSRQEGCEVSVIPLDSETGVVSLADMRRGAAA